MFLKEQFTQKLKSVCLWNTMLTLLFSTQQMIIVAVKLQ